MTTTLFDQERNGAYRQADIERTAKELQRMARWRFIRANITDDTPYKWAVLYYAYVSDMGSSEFMELFGHLAHAKADGTNTYASHETRAMLRGCSISASERSTTKLETVGWLPKGETKRRPNDSAIRIVRIPQVILNAFKFETPEPANSPGPEPAKTPDPANSPGPEPAFLNFGTSKNAGLTIVENLEEREGGEDASPSPGENGVTVNGASIRWAMGEILFADLDAAANRCRPKLDHATMRDFAAAMAQSWAEGRSSVPDDPVRAITEAVKAATKGKAKAEAKGTFLAAKFEDWRIPSEFWEIARSKGFPDDLSTQEFRRFHNFYASPDKPVNVRQSVNWAHRWTGWLDKPPAQAQFDAHRKKRGSGRGVSEDTLRLERELFGGGLS